MTDPDTDDLGPMPDPQIEPGEVNPGGVDAVEESDGIEAQDDELLSRDMSPDDNPAASTVPEAMKHTEDTSTEATRSEGDVESEEGTA